MNLEHLNTAIGNDAAIRRRQTLQPVGGKGDKIFPPTYPGDGNNAPPRHVFERRRVSDKEIWCVLVDSVQSAANRQEECLLEVIHEGVSIPYVFVDFSESNLAGITKITSLDAPHRVYDAIMRDSLLNGQSFLSADCPEGRHLIEASLADASALLELSPNALLFGSWNSTGQGGGLGAKFARCLTSEIVAVDVPVEEIVDRRTGEIHTQTAGRRTGSRIDPLGVVRDVKIYRSATNENDWTPMESDAARGGKNDELILFSRKKGDKPGRPSIINHGNVTPSVQPLGITCDHLEHSFVLSFAALRRLRFGEDAPGKNAAGRTMLAALGLLALIEQDARGYALRSRCDLVCEGSAPLEIVHADGSTESVVLDCESARQLYQEAFKSAKQVGFKFPEEPVRLTPKDKLVEIVRRSQELALRGAGEGEDDDGADA